MEAMKRARPEEDDVTPRFQGMAIDLPTGENADEGEETGDLGDRAVGVEKKRTTNLRKTKTQKMKAARLHAEVCWLCSSLLWPSEPGPTSY